MSYADELRKPQWQRKRLEIMARDDWRCTGCSADDKPLHVHHERYINGRKPWEYADNDLKTLCEECHSLFHKINDAYKAKDFDEKNQLLKKILGNPESFVKRGPFAIVADPRDSSKCFVIHIPSCSWQVFTLSVEAAVNMYDEIPSSRAELLSFILQGASYK
jgi:hypothetical protein